MANSVSTLEQHLQQVEAYEDATREAREWSEKCRDYYDHKQWAAEELAALRKRKQPPIINNQIAKKVDFLVGMEQHMRTDPKAFPRTPQHEKGAEAVTDTLRYVADNNDYDATRSACFERLLIEGTSGVEVTVEVTKRGREIRLGEIEWDRVYHDPHSRKKDFSDAGYFGVYQWMDYDDALSRYEGKEGVLDGALEKEGSSESSDDAPRRWGDPDRKRVKICKHHFQKGGQWHVAEFCAGGYLREPEVSPYLDEDGLPEPDLILGSAFVTRDGERYGPTRRWIELQDEINQRRSKGVHLISQRQTYAAKGSGGDPAKLKRELAKPDGHLEFEHGEFGKDFGVIPTNDMAAGNLQMLQEAKQELDGQGANAALTGDEGRSMSGRALQTRTQQGNVELGPLFDRQRRFDRQVYRAIWNRVAQFWDEEKWVRVTDDENNLKFVQLNKPVTVREKLEQEGEQIPPEFEGDPRLDAVVEVENSVAELDVDIIIEEAPDVVTLQHEQFEQLAALYPTIPEQMKPLAFEMLVSSSQLRNKDQFLEKLKGGGEMDPQQQQQMMMQQQMQQLEMASKQADVEKTQSEAAENMANAQKMQREAMTPPMMQ